MLLSAISRDLISDMLVEWERVRAAMLLSAISRDLILERRRPQESSELQELGYYPLFRGT